MQTTRLAYKGPIIQMTHKRARCSNVLALEFQRIVPPDKNQNPIMRHSIRTLFLHVFTVALLTTVAWQAQARVKLVALPERARTIIALDSEQTTLMQEERSVALQQGVNQLDFSWRGVNINSDSIRIDFPENPEGVNFLNTSFPPNENALVWEIASGAAQEVLVRITYLLHGIQRELSYKATVNSDETKMTLRHYLRLKNYSGEDLSNTEVYVGFGEDFTKSIENQEVLEMLSERQQDIPLRKVLTWDANRQPWDPEYQQQTVGIPLSYVFTNHTEAGLGRHTMPRGKARIFLRSDTPSGNGPEDNLSNVTFVGEDWLDLTPVDRKIDLGIGQSRDVKVVQRKTRDERTNLRRNDNNQVVLYDTDEIFKLEIENFKTEPAELIVVEHFQGYWRMVDHSHPYRKKDAFTIEFPLTLPAQSTGEKKTVLTFHIERLNVENNDPSSY